MAKPQIENGYTKIANELLEAMCRLYLSGNQWKVLHAIIRKTYGWNKKEDWVTATQIAQMTGMYAPHVSSALRVLDARHVVLRDGRLLAVQKDYEQWQMKAPCNHPKVTRTSNIEKLQEPVRKRTRTSNKSVQEPVRTKERKTPIQKTGATFVALAAVCQVDLRIVTDSVRGQLNQTNGLLCKKTQASPDDIRAFGEWWYKVDWRGKQGNAPRPAQVREEWGKFRQWQQQQEAGTKWIDGQSRT